MICSYTSYLNLHFTFSSYCCQTES